MTDLRTRAGQEQLIIDKIRQYGGFSIFFATETTRRAQAVDRLIANKIIIRNKGDQYPWCSYQLQSENQNTNKD